MLLLRNRKNPPAGDFSLSARLALPRRLGNHARLAPRRSAKAHSSLLFLLSYLQVR